MLLDKEPKDRREILAHAKFSRKNLKLLNRLQIEQGRKPEYAVSQRDE
jgi:hypothetical protein